MGTIRRTFGGFAVAAVLAAGLVLMPASAYAKNTKGGNTGGFCETLAAAIAYIEATYEGDLEAALLAPLVAAQEAYCPTPVL